LLESNYREESWPNRDHSNRTFRDIIALSTISTKLLGATPARLAETLLAALHNALSPRFSFVQLRFRNSQAPVQLAHVEGHPSGNSLLSLFGPKIVTWAADHSPDEVLLLPDPSGPSPLRVCVYPLGPNAENGVLAAGFADPHAPNEVQFTLLTIAANQALVACKLANIQQQQSRFYDTILSNTPDLIYVFDRDHRFTYANNALLTMWGRTWDEAIGKNCLELGYEPWHAAMHDREIDQVIATKRPIRGEVPFSGTHGRRIYEYIFVPVINASGDVEAIAGTTRDVTERKQQEQLLRFLVELNNATQALTDPDKIMAVTARLLAENLGVDRCAYAQVEDQAVFVITGDYTRGVPSIVGRWPVRAFGQDCNSLMLANEPYVVDNVDIDPRITTQDLPAYRATRIRAVICVPLHTGGKFTAAMAVHQATPRHWTPQEVELVQMVVRRCWESLERARSLHSLGQSEERLRFMAESMPQKIFTAKPDGSVDYYNPQFLGFTGYTLAEVSGWAWTRCLHPEDIDETVRCWKQALETHERFQIELRLRSREGHYRWHLCRAQPMRDPDGKVLLWVGSHTDIHDQKLAEEKLERIVAERTARLNETVHDLEAFSYSVAHDMRAPLRAMTGFSKIVLSEYAGQMVEQGKDYLQRIADSASRLDLLIQDVLSYSKIITADLPLESVDLQTFIPQIIDSYPNLETGQAEIRIEAPLPRVLANPAALTQVISNLLGNAVKFVAPGVRPRVVIRSK